jgi:hypothetical protein
MNDFHNREDIPLTAKFYSLYRLIYLWLKHFPKKERYTLGENLERTILELLTGISFTNQLPNALKEPQIMKLSAQNETLKILFRLAQDIKVLNLQQYLTAQSHLQETGRMLGGWLKFARNER